MAKKVVSSGTKSPEKASKSMGATSTNLFSKKGNKAYCPNMSKSKM